MIKDKLFLLLQKLVPQHALSRLTGKLASSRIGWLKNFLIRLFCHRFDIDFSEAVEQDYRNFESFNAFFTRALRPGVREVDASANSICSPADGSVSEIGSIDNTLLLQAKGQHYSLTNLLAGDNEMAGLFENGSFATIYLSPSDYHRVHMPVSGSLVKTAYIPGKLFSVNQVTADNIPGLFARNERLVCLFDTPHGPMAMILVGAMIVAAIETVWAGRADTHPPAIVTQNFDNPVTLNKGDEMGRFLLGSTVILLFGENAVNWETVLKAGSEVRFGQLIGNTGQSLKTV